MFGLLLFVYYISNALQSTHELLYLKQRERDTWNVAYIA
jgi:hypothetical protein